MPRTCELPCNCVILNGTVGLKEMLSRWFQCSHVNFEKPRTAFSWSQKRASEGFRAWEGTDVLLLVWRGKGPHEKDCEQLLVASRPLLTASKERRTFILTPSRNRILPTPERAWKQVLLQSGSLLQVSVQQAHHFPASLWCPEKSPA